MSFYLCGFSYRRPCVDGSAVFARCVTRWGVDDMPPGARDDNLGSETSSAPPELPWMRAGGGMASSSGHRYNIGLGISARAGFLLQSQKNDESMHFTSRARPLR